MRTFLDNRLLIIRAKGALARLVLRNNLKTSQPREFMLQDEVKILSLVRRDGAGAGCESAEGLVADGVQTGGVFGGAS